MHSFKSSKLTKTIAGYSNLELMYENSRRIVSDVNVYCCVAYFVYTHQRLFVWTSTRYYQLCLVI